MLSGFISIKRRQIFSLECLQAVLVSFLYLSVHATLEFVICFCSDWRYYEDCTLPDSIGCRFEPNSYNARTPGDWESLSLSFGLQALRLFQAYSGPLGGKGALLEFPLSHKVTTLGRTNFSAIQIKQKEKHREHSVPLL